MDMDPARTSKDGEFVYLPRGTIRAGDEGADP
jgi:hypothetical protein